MSNKDLKKEAEEWLKKKSIFNRNTIEIYHNGKYTRGVKDSKTSDLIADFAAQVVKEKDEEIALLRAIINGLQDSNIPF